MKPVIERAFELASHPDLRSVRDIKNTLKREGYVEEHIYASLTGQSLKAQLMTALRKPKRAADEQNAL